MSSDARSRRCAVIVCTRNRADMLDGGLAALTPTLRQGDELVVVDSASEDDATRLVAAAHDARLVTAPKPGLSRARNLGAASTTAEFVVFTDDDCRPEPGWLDHLMAGFDSEDVGFVLGQVRADVADAHLPFDAARPRDAARFAGPTDPIELGNGACMAFRRSAYEAVGGADERLGAGTALRSAEDHDLFCRLLRHHWVGVYAPDALVLHRDWRTHREVVFYNWGVGLGTGAMVAKLARLDGVSSVRALLRRRVMTDGLAELTRNVANRDRSAVVAHTLKLAGTLSGLAIGLVLPREGERFRSSG